MLYKLSYSVPANTTKNNPNWQQLKISKGKLKKWIVFFPDEAADQVQLRIYYHNMQIFPFTGGAYFYAFFEPVPIEDDLDVTEPVYRLDIEACNTDDKEAHEYNVYVLIEPAKKEAAIVPISQSIADRLKEIFGG